MRFKAFVFTLFLSVVAVCCFDAYAFWGKKKNSFKIYGYIFLTPETAAVNVPVKLYDKKTGRLVAVSNSNIFGKYKFKNVSPGEYVVVVKKFSQNATVVKKNVKVQFDLSSPDGIYHPLQLFAKGMVKEMENQQLGGDPGQTNPALQSWIAGEYYSYEGSTERKLMLCPNGIFYDSRESSYSGTSYDSGGNATSSFGAASANSGSGRWSINGNKQSGTITFCYKGKGCQTVKYYIMRDNCIKINGITFCYKGRPRCR